MFRTCDGFCFNCVAWQRLTASAKSGVAGTHGIWFPLMGRNWIEASSGCCAAAAGFPCLVGMN